MRSSTTAARLKEAMAEAGKKQADLARETGIDKGSISSYVTGRYEPKQDAINKLAVALNVSEMWLWGYDVPKERSSEAKKNDDLARIIVRMRKDAYFSETVRELDKATDAQLKAIRQLLSTL